MYYWKVTGSFLFVIFSPITLGALLFIPLMHFGVPDKWAIVAQAAYMMIWFMIWAGPLDEGRKLVI